MGCTDLCLIGVTGPLAGRMLTGNADGFWPPNVSSAQDFLSWYERWLDHMRDGKDNDALGPTSPATVANAPWGPRAGAISVPRLERKSRPAVARPRTPPPETLSAS